MTLRHSNLPAGRDLVRLLALILLAQTCALLFRSWLQLLLMRNGVDLWPAENLSYLVVPPVLALILYPIWRDRKRELLQAFRCSDLSLRIALVAASLGLLLRLANRALYLGAAVLGAQPAANAMAAPMIEFACPSFSLIGLHLVAMCLLTPLTEEIVNRAWLANWLARYGTPAAVIGSSLLFAVFHHPQGMASAFVFGVFTAKLYLVTRSLWGPLLTHAVYNASLIIDWYCLRVFWNPIERSPSTAGVGVLGLVVGLVALAVAASLVTGSATGQRTPGDARR